VRCDSPKINPIRFTPQNRFQLIRPIRDRELGLLSLTMGIVLQQRPYGRVDWKLIIETCLTDSGCIRTVAKNSRQIESFSTVLNPCNNTSNAGTFALKNFRSLERNSWNFRSRERKCGGTFFSQDRDSRRPNRLVCALILARMTTAAPCLLDYTIPHCAPTYTSRSAARLVENFRLRDPRTSLLDLGLGLIKHIIPQPLPIPLRQRIAYF